MTKLHACLHLYLTLEECYNFSYSLLSAAEQRDGLKCVEVMCFLLHILIQEYNLPIILLLASNLTNICSEISKLNGFMKGFYLQ